METLVGASMVWLGMLLLVQSVIFIISVSDGLSFWENYIVSWAKTLRALRGFLAPGANPKEWKESLIAWVLVALCLPGVIIVVHAVTVWVR